jgi:sodium-coupled neutral amino acid transporter 11
MTSNDRSDTAGLLRRSSSEHAEAETRSLLSTRSSDDLVVEIPPPQPTPSPIPPLAPVPRTPNRVRFALDEAPGEEGQRGGNSSWTNEEDFLHSDDDDDVEADSRGNRAPLLTGIEAPSVTVASGFDTEDLLENARPKSGMRMAFMNMANSIIGAGIIGEPPLSPKVTAFLSPIYVRPTIRISASRAYDGRISACELDDYGREITI